LEGKLKINPLDLIGMRSSNPVSKAPRGAERHRQRPV
jgi:hypothetical protein